MNKLIISYISILFIILQVNITKAEDYIVYNLEILNAQNFLLSENFDSALIVYKSAFKMVKKPFPKDYRNAALTAYHNDSILLMKEYLENAVINGYHWENPFKHYIKKSFNFYFKKDKAFLTYLEDQCEELIKIDYQNPIYYKYKALFDMDQKARKRSSKKKKQINIEISDKTIYDEIMKDGINEGFYPGYITAGTLSYTDLSFVFAMHLTIDNYETIIINAMKKGEITPNEAGTIYARQYKNHNKGSNCAKFPDLLIETNSFYKKEECSKLKEMGFKFDSLI
jgi:hypothetical protein